MWTSHSGLVQTACLQAATRFAAADCGAIAPGGQHARSNASQMPLERAGTRRCVFLHPEKYAEVRDTVALAHTCLRGLPLLTSTSSQSSAWALQSPAYPAFLEMSLPALPALCKLPAAVAPA